MPVFWLGLIRTHLIYRRRVTRERKLFDSAINPNHTEFKSFMIGLIVLGIIGSLLTSLLGIEVNYSWVFLYEGLATLCLLIPGLMFPFTVMLISIIILVLFGDQFLYLILSGIFKFLPEHTSMNMDFLALMTVVMILQYLFLKLTLNHLHHNHSKNVRGIRLLHTCSTS